MSGLRYSKAPNESAKHNLLEKSCQQLLNSISKVPCIMSLAAKAEWADPFQGVSSFVFPERLVCDGAGWMKAPEMFCFRKAFPPPAT